MMVASHGRFSQNGCGGCGCDVDADAFEDASGCVLCFFLLLFFEHHPEAHPDAQTRDCFSWFWSMRVVLCFVLLYFCNKCLKRALRVRIRMFAGLMKFELVSFRDSLD